MAFFDQQFWQSFVTTFVGVVLAIPAGFFLERKVEGFRKGQDIRGLALTYRQEILRLKSQLSKLASDISAKSEKELCFENIDIAVFTGTAATKYDLFHTDTCLAIESITRPIELINARLATARSIAFDQNNPALSTGAARGMIKECNSLIEETITNLFKVEDLLKKRYGS